MALQPGVGLGLLYNMPLGLSIPCSVSPFVYTHLSPVNGHVIQPSHFGLPLRLVAYSFPYNIFCGTYKRLYCRYQFHFYTKTLNAFTLEAFFPVSSDVVTRVPPDVTRAWRPFGQRRPFLSIWCRCLKKQRALSWRYNTRCWCGA
jgi:hypothetical protein